MELQGSYSPTNTSEMHTRGVLVRTDLPEAINALLPAPGTELITDWAVHGSDGIGRKTIVPWTRIYSASQSPRATSGWYVVYLFESSGERVYLSVNQGTTTPNNGQFDSRPAADLEAATHWARQRLHGSADLSPNWQTSIALSGGRLADGYEVGNVYAVEYLANAMPSEDRLVRELHSAVRLLSTLYGKDVKGVDVPTDSPEVEDTERAIGAMAGKREFRGRPFRQNAKQRAAIERRAMIVASEHLVGLGYDVEDVGSKRSYDLHATSSHQTLKVEVKGTTSGPEAIILTANEVALHQDAYPDNALAIVHGIELSGGEDQPVAAGGVLDYVQPWELNEEQLAPMAYRYATGLARSMTPGPDGV